MCGLCFQINYVSDIQLGFLKLLYSEAQQKFTYQCKRSVAWYSERDRNRNSAISFMGDNDSELNTDRLRDLSVIDGCRVSSCSRVYSVTIMSNMLPQPYNISSQM